MQANKVDVVKFALTGGIYGALMFASVTLLALLNVPGFVEAGDLLTTFYKSYGYSVSGVGIIMGALWGFVEGFIHIGAFAWIYKLLSK